MDATQLALLAGVCAAPEDNTARLVYADYRRIERAYSGPHRNNGVEIMAQSMGAFEQIT